METPKTRKFEMPLNEPGLSRGGEYFQNKGGVIEVPAHVDLTADGYKEIITKPQKGK